jgi:hypothetical protein
MRIFRRSARGNVYSILWLGMAVAALWPGWPSFTADAMSAPDNKTWTPAAPPRSANAPPLSTPITALVTPPDAPAIDARGNSAIPPPPKPGGDGGAMAGEGAAQHDPTQPGPTMRQLLSPRAKAASIPAIELKARMVTAGQIPVVILGIEKNLYLAKLGDEFSPVGEFSGLTIRVSTITAGEVRLEVTPLGRAVILY